MSEVAAELAEQTWPDFYPKGVPPKTAVDAEGEFYRLVRANPRPQIVSFLPMKSTRIDIRNVVEKLFSACMAHLFF